MIRYTVKTLKAGGLEAKWDCTEAGAFVLLARDPKSELTFQRDVWWQVTRGMWEAMKQEGIRPAFTRYTLLGDVFSVAA